MRIRIATLKTTDRIYQDGYAFKPVKYKWLANILWKLLNKLNAVEPNWIKEEVYTYDFSNADQKKLIDYLMASADIPYYFFDKPKDYKFVMGNKQFSELMHTRAVEFPLNFKAGPVYDQVQGEPVRVFDVEVEVLPWIDGVALVKK